MNLKITDVLREKLTLIYGGGMNGSFDRIPYANYHIGVSLPCGPDNVDKVIAATFGEIEKIKNEGPQQADLDKVKQNWIKARQIAMRTNGHWLGSLQDATLYGTDPAIILSYEKRINAITLDEIKDTAKRYFNMENYVQVVLYPEK
jgi:zinc protease